MAASLAPGAPADDPAKGAAIAPSAAAVAESDAAPDAPANPVAAMWAGDYLAWPQMRPLGGYLGPWPALLQLRAEPDTRALPYWRTIQSMLPMKSHTAPQPYTLLGENGEGGARVEALGYEILPAPAKSEQAFGYYCAKREKDGSVWPMEWFPEGALDAWEKACRDDDPLGGGCEPGVCLNIAAMLPLARKLADDFPERLTTRYWLVATLCLNGEIAEAQTLLERWRDDFENDPTWRGKHYLAMMEMDLKASEPANDDLLFDYDDFWFGLSSPAFSAITPPALVEVEQDIWFDWVARQAWVPPPCGFSMGDPLRPWEGSAMDTANVEGDIPQLLAIGARRMAAGERDAGRRFLLGFYCATKRRAVWQTEDELNVSATQELLAFNLAARLILQAKWSAEELESIWNEYSAEAASTPRASVAAYETPFWPPAPDYARPPSKYGSDDRGFYASVEAARALFLESLRILHYRAVTGEWPRVGPDGFLTGLLLSPETRYANPHRPGEPIRVAVAPEGMLLWAPQDDRQLSATPAEIEASLKPKFGLRPIFLPNEPFYDFPSDPGHVYADRAEWDRRYPTGLSWERSSRGRIFSVKPGPFADAQE